MEVYNVGVGELSEYDWHNVNKNDYVWIVFWYESGSWDGSGEMVALGNDGLLYYANLGHCSCYGPLEAGLGKIEVEKFLKDKEDIWEPDWKDVIKKKVRELLGK